MCKVTGDALHFLFLTVLLLTVCYAGSGDLESKLDVDEAEISQMRNAI
jgi:hypothetical protein